MIELDARLFEKYVVGKSRPYSLFVVADAKHLRSKGKLQLGALLRDYSAVARAFAAEHAGKPTEGRAFFVSVEYNAARDVMSRCEAPGIPAGAAVSARRRQRRPAARQSTAPRCPRAARLSHPTSPTTHARRLGINALPFLGRVPQGSAVAREAIFSFPEADKLHPAGYPWSADAIGGFVTARTRLSAGDVAGQSAPRSRRAAQGQGARGAARRARLSAWVCAHGRRHTHAGSSTRTP